MDISEAIVIGCGIISAGGVILGIFYRVVPKKSNHESCEKVKSLEESMKEYKEAIIDIEKSLVTNNISINALEIADKHKTLEDERTRQKIDKIFDIVNTMKDMMITGVKNG